MPGLDKSPRFIFKRTNKGGGGSEYQIRRNGECCISLSKLNDLEVVEFFARLESWLNRSNLGIVPVEDRLHLTAECLTDMNSVVRILADRMRKVSGGLDGKVAEQLEEWADTATRMRNEIMDRTKPPRVKGEED